MNSALHFATSPASLTTFTPNAQKSRNRRAKLVSILRQAAYLTSLQAYDEPQLHQRCALAKLVAAVDEGLKTLVNEGGEQ